MKMNPTYKLILDLGPLALFGIAFRLGGMQAAITALIAGTLASLLVIYAVEKRIAMMPLVSGILVTLLGGLTLLLHDEYYIKIKPTVVNLCFAGVLFGGLCFGKPLLKYLLGDMLPITDGGWRRLSFRWAVFFCCLAAINEYIWRHYPTETWVNFKVFGLTALSAAFSLMQVPLIKRCWVEEAKSDPE